MSLKYLISMIIPQLFHSLRKDMLMSEELLTTAEVAKRLKVDQRTVWAYRTRKIDPLPCYKIGALRFKWSEIEAWLERQKVQRGA